MDLLFSTLNEMRMSFFKITQMSTFCLSKVLLKGKEGHQNITGYQPQARIIRKDIINKETKWFILSILVIMRF